MTGPEARAPAARLARLGFADTGLAAAGLAGLELDPEDDPDGVVAELLGELAGAADPDLALRQLAALAAVTEHRDDLLCALRYHLGLRQRLIAVLGASEALGDHLLRHPADWQLLADDALVSRRPSAFGLHRTLLAAVGAGDMSSDADEPLPWGSGGARSPDSAEHRAGALRLAYRRQLLMLAVRDLAGGLLLDDVAAELSDLAAAALDAALAVAAADLPPGSIPVRLALIGMGKCGGHELNYVSDVDVLFVAEPLTPAEDGGATEAAALRTATRLAEGVLRVCGQVGSDGSVFAVDPNLRPEGRSGPLVRSLRSHLAYYGRWARTWEFQALLKARPIAGDLALGRRFCEQIEPLVWTAGARDGFVADVRAMRRRVEASVPAAQAGRQLKLGPGGLRDVEFTVQLLQLVHGRADPALRSPSTLPALAALRDGGYVGREDADTLAEDYRWLRGVEHRLQLQGLRRTHSVPPDPHGLRWIARATGHRDAEDFETDRQRRAAEVRRLHEKLFSRPLLDAVARLPADGLRLSQAGARDRLSAMGFADPDGALRHLSVLAGGVRRRATVQRALLPVMLDAFADSADPDAALLAFRQVSDSLGDTPWYLRALRDEGATAERFAKVLAAGSYAAGLLTRVPEALRLLTEDTLVPRSRAEMDLALAAVVDRAPTWEDAAAGARAVRRVELLRIACADLLGQLGLAAVGAALTAVAQATIGAALRIAVGKVETELRSPLPARLAVVALGRLGGGELGYGSDADVVFVFAPLPGADEQRAAEAAHAVAHETRRLLALPAPDPPLLLDAGLRPEGRQGPLVRSLAAYIAYHARWASVWEAQALLRAAPLAGDEALTQQFLTLVADPARCPRGGFGDDQVAEIRRLKRRIETERAGGRRDLKLGPGGLSDVEWTVQLLQLRHGWRDPGLLATGTLPALAALEAAGLVSELDAAGLRDAWQLAARARNAVTLVTGRSADVLPAAGSRELAGVARLLGYPPEAPAGFEGELALRTARAREVVARLFYGGTS